MINAILLASSQTEANFCKGCKMSRVQIGRTVRRLRTERNLSQQALANRLGISASYLNLIEHDQRAVSGTLLIKLAEIFHLDLATLSGSQERRLEIGLREAFSDPLLGVDAIAERLRKTHGLTVTVQPLDGVLRRFDPDTRRLALAETLPRESRGFHMAFQIALFEARDAIETVLHKAAPSSAEAAMLIRVGL